jgi:hypothetical protein
MKFLHTPILAVALFARCIPVFGQDLPPPEEALEDSIFLGADIQIMEGKTPYQVTDFADHKWRARSGNKEKHFSPKAGVTIKKTLKHSDQFIELSGLEAQPFSTEAQNRLDAYGETVAQIAQQQSNIDSLLAGMGPKDPTMAQAGVDWTETSSTQVMSRVEASESEMRIYEDMLQFNEDEIAESTEKFDGLQVRFTAESPVDLDRCFVLVLAKYRPNEEFTPNLDDYDLRTLFHAEEIGKLEAGRPQTLQFLVTGFTKGPLIEEMSYHIYSRGKEIPSAYSSQRLPLTASEAFDFLYADYVSQADGKNEPPRPFKRLDPSDLQAVLSPGEIAKARVRFLVDSGGYVRNARIQGVSGRAKEEQVAALVEQLFFFPALNDGIPEDRELRMELTELVNGTALPD